MSSPAKEAVRRHWDADPCGAKLADAEPGTREFFAQVESTRYALEPFIDRFADFEHWDGCDVLEVGVGLGSDFIRFVRAGANATGIDLTQTAVDLVRRRLELEGLEARLEVGDAEELQFETDSFDLAYSWGVLHHTPDTERAVSEVRRVLKPGGEARIMLYARHSWFAYGVWFRRALLSGMPFRSVSDVLAHHLESPGTKAYTQGELRKMFSAFSNVEIRRFLTPYDRRVAGPLASLTGSNLGWFAGIVAS